MTDKILYWTTAVCTGLALLLFLTNASLIHGNQRIQGEINQRQNIINTAMNVQPLNQQLSQAIFDASVKTDDAKLRELLTSQGFTLPSKAPAKATEAAKAPAKAPVAKITKEEE